jgi:2-oxoglutarate dehydrogenase E2 component (dihydrolipoamide succinyltransferase)
MLPTNPRGRPKRRCRARTSTLPTPDHADLTLSPAVRRAVLEHHVDPSKISGSGKDGRITKDDVLLAAKAKGDGADSRARGFPVPRRGRGPRPKRTLRLQRRRRLLCSRPGPRPPPAKRP